MSKAIKNPNGEWKHLLTGWKHPKTPTWKIGRLTIGVSARAQLVSFWQFTELTVNAGNKLLWRGSLAEVLSISRVNSKWGRNSGSFGLVLLEVWSIVIWKLEWTNLCAYSTDGVSLSSDKQWSCNWMEYCVLRWRTPCFIQRSVLRRT